MLRRNILTVEGEMENFGKRSCQVNDLFTAHGSDRTDESELEKMKSLFRVEYLRGMKRVRTS